MIGDGRDLEREVEDELRLAEASRPDEEALKPVADWQFDPTDAQRYEVGLHSLLDAVEAPPVRPLRTNSREGDTR